MQQAQEEKEAESTDMDFGQQENHNAYHDPAHFSWDRSLYLLSYYSAIVGLVLSFSVFCNEVFSTFIPSKSSLLTYYHVLSHFGQKFTPSFLSGLWFSKNWLISLTVSSFAAGAFLTLQAVIYSAVTGKSINDDDVKQFVLSFLIQAIATSMFFPFLAQFAGILAYSAKFVLSIAGVPSFAVNALYWATLPCMAAAVGFVYFNLTDSPVQRGVRLIDILTDVSQMAIIYAFHMYYPARLRLCAAPFGIGRFVDRFTPEFVIQFGRRVPLSHVCSLVSATIKMTSGLVRPFLGDIGNSLLFRQPQGYSRHSHAPRSATSVHPTE